MALGARGPVSSESGRPQRVRRWARRVMGALVLGLIVAVLIYAWLPKPVPVDTARVWRGDLRVMVEEDGKTRVEERYVISAPLAGDLVRIEYEEGDIVLEGDVLATILPLAPALLDARNRAQAEAQLASARAQKRQADTSVERARAAVELATLDAERQEALVSRGAEAVAALDRARTELRVRTEELDHARLAARVALHQVELAEAALERFGSAARDGAEMQVTAPISGVVLRVMQTSAGVVQAGTDLIELGDPAQLEIVVDVLSRDAVVIPRSAPVLIERWGGEATLSGHVKRVEPSAFTTVSALGVEEQRVNVLIGIDSPRAEWASLGDGFRIEARIVVEEVRDTLVLPATSVFRRGDEWAVFRVEEGRARLVPIGVGARSGIEVEARRGLAEGDVVIMHPSDRVVDGVRVELRSR